MVGSNILDILSLCGCPTKLLLQHGSFVCAVTVTSDTHVHICYITYVVFCTVYCSLLQKSLQTLGHKFEVAAVRGVVRNKNITEFQLEPCISDQQVVDGILTQLTADERRKFKVGRGLFGYPSIELCQVGEWCIVHLLMQCLYCVCQVLSQLYQRSSTSFSSWLCWVGWG